MDKFCHNIQLFVFLQVVLFICLVIILMKRFTNRDRIMAVSIACVLFFGIAFSKKDYVAIFFMVAVAISILATASTHEYLFNNYPTRYSRSILIYEKADFMFLPIWWYLFYIILTYSYIVFYRLVVQNII